MLRWDEQAGAVLVFRNPAFHANGQDRQGQLVSYEHLTGG